MVDGLLHPRLSRADNFHRSWPGRYHLLWGCDHRFRRGWGWGNRPNAGCQSDRQIALVRGFVLGYSVDRRTERQHHDHAQRRFDSPLRAHGEFEGLYVSMAVTRAGCIRAQLQFSLPAIATDGSVYVGTSGAGLWKINASGAVVWQTNPGGAADFYSPPTIGSDGRIYVVGYAAAYSWNMLLAVGPATGLSSAGSLLCGGNKGAPNKVNAPMIGSDGTIYMISDGVPVTGPPECPLEAFH